MLLLEEKDRFAYGLEGEKAVADYIRKFGWNVRINEVGKDGCEPKHNLIGGDIYIEWQNTRAHPTNPIERQKWLKLDVKRGTFIAQKSLEHFQGQFYCLIPKGDITDIENARIIRRGTILSYIKDIPSEKYIIGPSGDKGLRFGRIKKYMILKDFVTHLVKLRLLNADFTSKEFWSKHMTFDMVE